MSGRNETLAALLAAWRADVDSEPVPPMPALQAALTELGELPASADSRAPRFCPVSGRPSWRRWGALRRLGRACDGRGDRGWRSRKK